MATLKKLNSEQIEKIIHHLERANEVLNKEEDSPFSAHTKVGYAQGTCTSLLKMLKGEWPL